MKYNNDFMLVLAGFAAVGHASRFADCITFVAEHNKNYVDVNSVDLHWIQWQSSDAIINQINEDSANSGNPDSSTAGHNFTSDITPDELAKLTGRTQDPSLEPVSLSTG